MVIHWSEGVTDLRVQTVPEGPVVPEPWVVIAVEGVNPAQFKLPAAVDVTAEQALGANAVVEGDAEDFGVDATHSDEGHQLQRLLVLFPCGPDQFGAGEPAAVATDQTSRKTPQAYVTAQAEGHAAGQRSKGVLTGGPSAPDKVRCDQPGHIQQSTDGAGFADVGALEIEVVAMAALGHSGQTLQEIEVGVPAGAFTLVADVGAEFEIPLFR